MIHHMRPEQAALLALFLLKVNASPIGQDSYHTALSNTLPARDNQPNPAVAGYYESSSPAMPSHDASSVGGASAFASSNRPTETAPSVPSLKPTDNCDEDTKSVLSAASQCLSTTQFGGTPYLYAPTPTSTQVGHSVLAPSQITSNAPAAVSSAKAYSKFIAEAGTYLQTTVIGTQTYIGVPVTQITEVCSSIAHPTTSAGVSGYGGAVTSAMSSKTQTAPGGNVVSGGITEMPTGGVSVPIPSSPATFGQSGVSNAVPSLEVYSSDVPHSVSPVITNVVSTAAAGESSAAPIEASVASPSGYGQIPTTTKSATPVTSTKGAPTPYVAPSSQPIGYSQSILSTTSSPAAISQTGAGAYSSVVPSSVQSVTSSAVPAPSIYGAGSSQVAASLTAESSAAGYMKELPSSATPVGIQPPVHSTEISGMGAVTTLPEATASTGNAVGRAYGSVTTAVAATGDGGATTYRV